MFKKPKASRQIRRRDDDDEGARGASDDVDAATTATTTTATTTTTTTADLSAHDARALLRHRHRRTHGLDADELSKASVLATAAQLTGRSAAGMNTKRKRRGLTGEQLSDGDDDDGANDDPWKLTSGGGLVDLKKIKAGGGGGPGGSNVDMGGVNVARKSMFQGSASATGGAQDVEKHMHRYIEDKLRAKLLETQKKRASAESGGNADDGDVDANGDAEVNAAAMLGEVKLLQAVQETLDSESAADGSRRTIVVDKDQLLHELPKELTEEASELLVAKRNESEIQVTVSMGQLMNVPEVDIGYESKKETYDETQRVLAEKRRTKPQPDSASRYAAAAKAITDMPSEASGFFYRRPIRHLTTINGVPAHVMDARYRARMAATGSVGSAIVGGRDDWQERKAQSGGGGDRGSFQGGGRGGYHAGAGGSGRGGHADGGTSGPGGEQQQQVQFSNFQRRFHTNDNLQQPRPKYYKRRQ